MIMAIGIYGVLAYATRPTTPLLTALVNEELSWRWIFWLNVPLAILAFPLVLRCIKPDRPPQPMPLRIDWTAITMFVIWVVCLAFTFGWYRKWGGWTSRTFTAIALLDLILAGSPRGLGWRRPGGERTLQPHLPRPHLRPRNVRPHAHAAAVAGGADPDGKLLPRTPRLPPGRDRLDPGPGVADHDGLDDPDHLVSSPRLATRLAVDRRRWLRGLSVVDVLRGQLHRAREKWPS